jgi:ABC-2 type transport system permease protein
MNLQRCIRGELRKLTTTRMPLAFLAVLLVISATTATAVIWGTDADGSKGFIATAQDQQSLVAFALNAMIVAGLFGGITVAREYGHNTVVHTFLMSPRRHRAVIAQYVTVLIGGATVGIVGAGTTVAAVAASLTTTQYGFMMSTGAVAQVIAASAFAGAWGALLGAGIGTTVRNTGGAVAGAVLVLFIVPPIVVQLVPEAIDWVPGALTLALSGLGGEVGTAAALAAVAGWGIVPAAIGLAMVLRRDVV